MMCVSLVPLTVRNHQIQLGATGKVVGVRLTIRSVMVEGLQHLLIQSDDHDVGPNVEFITASHRMRLVGHPIFVVGTMIILFQVTVPPRVGLSMELTVAAMLILLGVLNLTGALRWLQEKINVNSPIPAAAGLRSDGDLAGTQCGESAAHAHGDGVKAKLRLPRMLRSLGLFQRFATTGHWHRPRPRGFSSGGTPGYDDYSRSVVGHHLSFSVWHRHHRGNDDHHSCGCDALCLHGKKILWLEPRNGRGLGAVKSRLCLVPVLSDRFRRWSVHHSSALDPAMTMKP